MAFNQQLSALLVFRIKLTLRSQKGMLIGLPIQMLLVLYIIRIIADAVIVPEQQVEVRGFKQLSLLSYIGDPKGSSTFSGIIAGNGQRNLKDYHRCFQSTYYPLNRLKQCNAGFMIKNYTEFTSIPADPRGVSQSKPANVSYTLLIDDVRYESGIGTKAEEIIQGLEKIVNMVAGDPPVKANQVSLTSLASDYPESEIAYPRFDHMPAQSALLKTLMSSAVGTESQMHNHIHGFQWEPIIRVVIPAIVWIFSMPLSRFISLTATEIRSHYRYYFKLSGLSPKIFTTSLSIIYTVIYFVLAIIASSFIFGMAPIRANAVFYVPLLLWWCFNCSITALVLGEKWDGSGSSGYFFLLLLPWIALRQYGGSVLPQFVMFILAALWPQYSLAELFYAFVESFANQEALPIVRLLLIFLAQSVIISGLLLLICSRLTSKRGRNSSKGRTVPAVYESSNAVTVNNLPESVSEEVANLSKNQDAYSLRVYNLRHEYSPGNPILKGVSFGIKNNECLGFLGINGAGKSTTINSLTGMINPTAGRAILNGVDLIPFSEDLIGRIGICTQHDILYPNMTVYDHLRLFCHVKRIPLQTHSQQIENLLEDYNLTLMKNRNVGELSGGNRRKLTLALSCLSNPDIIFLDEPTTGIDIRARKMIWDVVLKMKKRCSIFLTSHSMDEIAYLCDRICILNEGVISFIGPPHGFRYELLIQISPKAPTQRIAAIVGEVFGKFQAEFVSRIGSMMTFYLNCKGEEDLSTLLQLMETVKARQGLEEIVEVGLGEANLMGLWLTEIGNK